jgi:disulfide bond formation protein DsbB
MSVLFDWIDRRSLYLALLAAWVATLGSLYFSEVAGYVPCVLCWYQRILMYPLALVLAIGLLRRDPHLPVYVLPFSLTGLGIATYHYLLEKTLPSTRASRIQKRMPRPPGCPSPPLPPAP